jgi:uncharacterized protein (DUF1330 family)
MNAYAIAHLRSVRVGPDIVRYLEQIDATLTPFGGRFIVHAGSAEVLEGEWPRHPPRRRRRGPPRDRRARGLTGVAR